MKVKLTYILILILLAMNGAAMAQGGGSTPHVTIGGSVFGGGNLASVNGKSTVLVNQANATMTDVYGGGALANVGATAADSTTVTILDGVINGNVYGGGLGDSIQNCYGGSTNTAALVYGKVYVNIGDNTGGPTINGSVFGCNNINGTPLDSVFVNIYKTAHTTSNSYPTGITTMAGLQASFNASNYDDCFAIEAVYGGGNKASYKPSVADRATTVHVYGCTENTIKVIYGGGNAADVGTSSKHANTRLIIEGGRFDQIFGGGNGYSASGNHDPNNCNDPDYNPGANITGTASTDIQGGLYRQIFGGSNQFGDVDVVALSIDKTCDNLLISEAFGGANEAELQANVETNLGCGDYEIGSFYGGSNKANIVGDVTLNVYGGTYTNVFGGSKGVAAATGLTAVPANIGGDVTLNLFGGTMLNAFGGSDKNGNITGGITVNVLDLEATNCGLDVTNIYGASNETAYTPTDPTITSPVVNVMHIAQADGIKGNVFGGGNLAAVTANPTVNIGYVNSMSSYITAIATSLPTNYSVPANSRAYVTGKVFGGGNEAGVTNTVVNINSGIVKAGVYGGCNTSGTVGGNIAVNLINGQVGTDATHRADVFGGGYGSNTYTSGDIAVNLNSTTIYGDLYGGSAFGSVNNATANPANTTTLTINGSALHGTIYGGGKGDVTNLGTGHDNVTAVNNGNVIVNYNTANTALTGLYGGANVNGNVKGDITVNVLANVGATGTGNSVDVFGGGLGAATNTEGNVTVNIGTATTAAADVPVIYGDIYGGSALGNVNNAATDLTKVDFLNGTLHGNIYGGGLGDANNAAKVNGEVIVNISSANQDGSDCHINLTDNVSIYGCNNTNGSPQADVTVNIYKTGFTSGDYDSQSGTLYAIDQVFGGGKNADYLPENGATNSDKVAKVYVHDCANSIRRVFSGGDAADATGVAAIIDGGRFDYIFGGGNGEVSEANILLGGTNLIVHAGIINHLFGGSNERGTITGSMNTHIDGDNMNAACAESITEFFGGGNLAPITGDITTTLDCGIGHITNVYGGSNMASITGDVTLTIKGGNYTNAFGGSKGVAGTPGTPANIDGDVTLNLHGGTIVNAFGGSDQKGNITGQITVNVLDFETTDCELDVTNIYGGGNVTPYTPSTVTLVSPAVNVMHIKQTPGVRGDVFGGGLGATAIVTACPMVKVGYDATTMSGLLPTGYTQPANGFPRAVVTGDVYGGGSLAAVTGNTSVLIQTAGTEVKSNVFGGGSQAGVSGTSTVQVANGIVGTGVYGGCNVLGSVGGTAEVIVTGGAIGSSGQHANVYGGGLGPDTRMNGDVLVTIGATNGGTPPTYSGSAVITGDVYGGSAKGKTNCNDAGTAHQGSSKTDVTLYGGTIDGDLYGGGHGIDNAAANVYGPVQVTVNKGTVTGSVYGCNNAAGAPQSTVKVDIYGTDAPGSGLTYALGNVFGGGNQAAYGSTPDVTIHNCDNSIGYVYGGGNKASVAATNVRVYGGNTIGYVFGGGNGEGVAASYEMVEGNAVTNIYGGTILHVFGGNNSSGKISGAVTLTVNKQAEGSGTACDMKIGEVYGGGNLAAGNAGAVNIGCTGDWTTTGTNNHTNHNNTDNRIGYELEGIGTVYGGANAADIGSSSNNSNITLNINSGMVDNVFGGNNTSGTIYGTIQVNINKTSDACSWYVGNVFGGGNLADYSGVPVVTLTNGPVSHNIYGGGNEAGVGGSLVNINGGSVGEGVYGGCNTSGTVNGNITVNITGDNTSQTTIGTDATHRANIHGGGYGESTETTGNVTVNFGTLAYDNTSGTPVEIHSEFPKLYGDIYGGSALGEVNGGPTNTTTVNILNGELITNQTTSANGFPVYNGGNVFGGGLGRKAASGVTAAEAKVYGTVTVNIGAPHSRTLNPDDDTNVGRAIIQGNVYGCNNTNGSPQDSVVVNIYRTNRTADDEIYGTTYALHNVFGGGNEADYIPATTASNKKLKVYVHNCYNSIERVFGGSNAAAAGAVGNTVTVHTLIEGGRFNNVFGGGNGEVSAANIKGDVKLEIHGGIVNEFFVGSNQSGTITGNSNVIVDEASHCESVLITEFFCGGKYADVEGNIEASINCSDALTVTNLYGGCKEADVTAGNGQPGNVHLSVYGGHYTNVFGGSKGDLASLGSGHSDNSADIAGNVVLDLYGGTMENVYGGSNVNGNISGTITVNVIDAESQTCPLYITNIYGGSNLTSYTPTNGANLTSPVVNVVHIKSGVRGNVYGASKGVVGTAATVTANPQVNIGYDASQMSSLATYLNTVNYSVPAAPRAIISGSVFGGGDAATVIGNTEIFLRKKAKVFGNVYGGGNMGEVTGNTKVIVNGQNN